MYDSFNSQKPIDQDQDLELVTTTGRLILENWYISRVVGLEIIYEKYNYVKPSEYHIFHYSSFGFLIEMYARNLFVTNFEYRG